MTVAPTAETPWIFDADGHVIEPEAVWTDLPAKFADYIPRRVHYANGASRLVVYNRMGVLTTARSLGSVSDEQNQGAKSAPAGHPGGYDPAARLPDMDIDHIETAALFPTIGLFVHTITEREPQVAMCTVINNWIATYLAYSPDRLIGMATLPGHPDDALAEARRCVEELGFRGVWRRPEMFEGLPALHAIEYEPLWSYLSAARVPFFIHPGWNGVVPQEYFTSRFPDNYIAGHATHFPVEQMMAMTSFVCYGVLERHPGLKVGFLETGGVWALYFLHRLDEHLDTFADRRLIDLDHDASYYFRRQCLVTVEDAEPGIEALLARYPDNVAFASDYPHADGTFPGSTASLLATTALTETQRRGVLRDNARRLFFS